MAALQFIDCPGYAAILFRRTFADLTKPGALMDRAHDWLGGTDAKWEDKSHLYRFPSGASLSFGNLEVESQKYMYQSAEFQYCVMRGTGILMADGSSRPIEKIRIGEQVQTLVGPRSVLRVHRPGKKKCVQVETKFGSDVVSAIHKVLTPLGWVSPQALQPTQSHGFCSKSGASGVKRQESYTRGELTCLDPERGNAPSLQTLLGSRLLGSDAWLRDGQIDFGESGGSRRGSPPPLMWYAPVVLHEPFPQSTEQGSVRECRRHADSHVCSCLQVTEDLLLGCRAEYGYSDEQLLPALGDGPVDTPSPVDAETSCQNPWVPEDDPRRVQARTPGESLLFRHPYTNNLLVASSAVQGGWAQIVPVGEMEVLDLTVDGASHYITTSSRLVNSNCGFDELTQFSESQFRYLFSRLRRPRVGPLSRIPLRMRAASNPGGLGHAWVRRRFIEPWKLWKGGKGPKSDRSFHPAVLDDLRDVIDVDAYEAQLKELRSVEYAQLRYGDWDLKPEGRMFAPGWFRFCKRGDIPAEIQWVRFWDLAATEPKPGTDPDYTSGALLGRDPRTGMFYLANVYRFRRSPEQTELAVRKTAERDGFGVPVYLEQEPGASGKILVDTWARRVLQGYTTHGLRATGSKIIRATPLQSVIEKGHMLMLEGIWNGQVLDELELYPDSDHDDICDSISGAHMILTRGEPSYLAYAPLSFEEPSLWKGL